MGRFSGPLGQDVEAHVPRRNTRKVQGNAQTGWRERDHFGGWERANAVWRFTVEREGYRKSFRKNAGRCWFVHH
jgi:hypothetical protein